MVSSIQSRPNVPGRQKPSHCKPLTVYSSSALPTEGVILSVMLILQVAFDSACVQDCGRGWNTAPILSKLVNRTLSAGIN